MKRLLPVMIIIALLLLAGCSLLPPEAAPSASPLIALDAEVTPVSPVCTPAEAPNTAEEKASSVTENQPSSTFLTYSNVTVTAYEAGEALSVTELSDVSDIQAVQDIVFDYMLKSAAWEGVEVSELEKYVEISFDWTANAVRQVYYQYDMDGTHVLQPAEGMYTVMSDKAYQTLLGLLSAAK
ncbi:MAG: hypothetical protein PHO41_08105 [Eubacteriales bacterium]|nr:hypothetical protein [Eubacteriales bacterium]